MTEKHVFVVCPTALRRLCLRMGIGYVPRLGDRMVEARYRVPGIVRWANCTSVLVKFAAQDEYQTREVGFALFRWKVFPEKSMAARSVWKEDVDVKLQGGVTVPLSEWEQRHQSDYYVG